MLATLYAIGMAILMVYGANLLWLALAHAKHDRLRTGPVPDPDDLPHPTADWPRVTVQLPLFNEAYVAERLIDACAALNYPRHLLEIQVLDDSTDETVDLVAKRVAHWEKHGLDIVHIHRTNRQGYKAGALAHGMRLASGAFIAIFDADFIPTADFLQRTIPHFDDDRIGLVQARWGHLNDEQSILTRMQAFGLDTHFAMEQHVRNLTGCFINFNGTAGIWRTACIEDAGGWQSDTLTEDLDLSFRAQMRGWQFTFLPDVVVPAELPVDMNAFRNQQFRWTKGAAQTTRKMLGTFLRSDQPWPVKLEGTIQLTAHIAFPFVVLVAALHAPLLLLKNLGQGPSDLYFAIMGFGMLGFVGFFLAQLFAQRALYPDWWARMKIFPVFLAGSMGMAISNTRAILEAWRGKKSAFVRTPKYRHDGQGAAKTPWWKLNYAETKIPGVVWLELLLLMYCLAGLGIVIYYGEWAAVPFQALFAFGFGLVTLYNVQQYWQARRTT